MQVQREQLTVRQIADSELQATYNLIRDIYASTEMMCQPFSEKYPDFASFKADVAEHKKIPGALFLIAASDNGLLGYVTVKPVAAEKLAHTAYLNMGVSEMARGRSIGRELLSAAIADIESEGKLEIVYLNVRADNTPAVKLYESAKFETIAVLTRDTKIGDKYYDGFLMRRFLR